LKRAPRGKVKKSNAADAHAAAGGRMRPVLLACALCVLANAGAVELTRENYDALTAGKTVFIKAYAPWRVQNVI